MGKGSIWFLIIFSILTIIGNGGIDIALLKSLGVITFIVVFYNIIAHMGDEWLEGGNKNVHVNDEDDPRNYPDYNENTHQR